MAGLDEYDAVAYFDNDIEFQGDITPLLKCAATGLRCSFVSNALGGPPPCNSGIIGI